MGNSAGSALPFELIETVEYERKEWVFHKGLKKEDKEKRDEVSILKFAKAPQDNKQIWVPAQRSVQKLRTMKHPFIVSYVDSLEIEDAILLVTESSLPLSAWVKKQLLTTTQQSISPSSTDLTETSSQLLSEVVWGLRCLLEALLFLNSTCNMTHGFIGPHSIFVCKTGDWKLGALELAVNLNIPEDREYYKSKMYMLNDKYISPERRQFSKSLSGSTIDDGIFTKQGAADMYALGIIMLDILEQMHLTPPSKVGKCLNKMIAEDYKKRPTAKQALSFITDQLDLLTQLNELAIKPPNESIEILGKLSEHLKDIPVSACHHKVLPNVTKVLQMACHDFRNRDSRESCRQSVQLSLTLLSSLSTLNKLDSVIFTDTCLPVVMTLWSMSDRTIRTALLKSLPQLIQHIPESYVNKSLFEPMLNGFGDTNAKMREETLKNLACVVDKLDERNLQDKLVRCITGLQADSEASIRTNAVIFIGRIASKLKDGVRARILCNALLKALKDSFVHCRIAGLKASVACLTYIDIPQLSSKMLPAVCLLTVDRSADVRELSFHYIEISMVGLKDNHNHMKTLAQNEKDKAAMAATTAESVTGTGAGGGSGSSQSDSTSGWSSFSWSAVDGLAKTLEKTIISSTSTPTPIPTSTTSNNNNNNTLVNFALGSSTHSQQSNHTPLTPTTTAMMTNKSSTVTMTGSNNNNNATGWDDDDDFDNMDFNHIDEDNDDNDDNSSKKNNNSNKMTTPVKTSIKGWQDHDDNINNNEEDEEDVFASKPLKIIDKKKSSNMASPTTTTTTATSSNSKLTSSSMNKKKSVTKLVVSDNESWDDF